MAWLLTHGDYMAGLSSIMAITRPLGEVNLTAMNRCVGVYKVYLNGGGGGGGGFDDFAKWYGGEGSYAEEESYIRSMAPPITLSAGAGGSASSGYVEDGEQGGTTSMGDSRVASIISASGGYGGRDTDTERSLTPVTPRTFVGEVYERFTVSVRNTTQGAQYFPVTTGLGGGSLEPGSAGGIIKAFRIG